MTEDEVVGWHHRLNGHEFEQAPEVGDGQGGLACCSAWGHKESNTTQRLNNNNLLFTFGFVSTFIYFSQMGDMVSRIWYACDVSSYARQHLQKI